MEVKEESAVGRAKRTTLSTFRSVRFWLFELLCLAGLTILVVLWSPTWVSKGVAMTCYQVLVPVAGVILGLVLVFLGGLLLAPYRQRDEARTTLKQMAIPIRHAVWPSNPTDGGLECYVDRPTMVAGRRGGIDEEAKVAHLWVASETFGYLKQMDKTAIFNITRVIVLDPECEWFKTWAKMGGENESYLVDNIMTTTALCLQANIAIRWYNRPIMNVIVANPRAKDAWARVQTHVPYTSSARWPSVIVNLDKPEESNTYDGIVDAFERMWSDSFPPVVHSQRMIWNRDGQ